MREIYLDNCATTRVDDDIAALAVKMMLENYGNPSSLHKKGLEAQLSLDDAREQTAKALGVSRDEIIFTSGGTEANNLAIFGAAKALRRSGKTVISTAWEHSSALSPVLELEKNGYSLKLINPGQDGRIDIEAIADVVDEDTVLVSCMLVNSEVGYIADIERLSKLVRRKSPKAHIHCDAVQGFGKIKFSAKKLGVDTLSVSGHKIHAPKGTGALYLRKGSRILPLLVGGAQEKSLRSGTQAVPMIAAFGLAAEVAASKIDENYTHIKEIYEYFVNKSVSIGGLCMNSPAGSTPYICNISIPGYRSEIMLHYLASKGVFVSSGSACSSGKPSHVLTAMGLSRERIDSALRVSFSKYSSKSDVDAFCGALSQGLREIKI